MGKTFVTTSLMQRLQESGARVAAMKPVACGNCGRDDALRYWKLAAKKIPLSSVNPYWFRKPLAPLAQVKNPCISARKIRGLFRRLQESHDIVLVESAGGLLTPLTWSMSVRDMAVALGLPLIVVARAGLGTLNHTLLTVEAARTAGLKVIAVVLNDTDGTKLKAAPGNRRVLKRILGIPVIIQEFENRDQKR
jgi:dethiobiotin synthetase